MLGGVQRCSAKTVNREAVILFFRVHFLCSYCDQEEYGSIAVGDLAKRYGLVLTAGIARVYSKGGNFNDIQVQDSNVVVRSFLAERCRTTT
jgi:hypothetical protein